MLPIRLTAKANPLIPIRINVWPWILPLILLSLWYSAAQEGWMPEQILPAPSLVLDTAWSLARADLFTQWMISVKHLIVGLFLGVVSGTLLGALFGLCRAVSQRVEPLFYLLAQIPTLGWIPLFMVLFGIDDGLKWAIIIKTTLVPMTIHTQLAVNALPTTLSEAASVMKFSRWQRLRWLVIPASLPHWFTGFRLALSQAWVSLIAVELLASSAGIGYLMVWGRQLFQLDIVFVTIVIVGVSGVVMDWAANLAYSHWVYWPQLPIGRARIDQKITWRALQLPIALVIVWQVASQYGYLSQTLFSSPSNIAHRFIQGVMSGELTQALFVSLSRTLAGAALGISIGLLTGIVLALRPFAQKIISPTLYTLRHIALFAWLPLLTAWVGNDNGGKITFIAIASFFPMFFSTLQAILQRSPQLDEVAQVMGLDEFTRLRKVILPGAAPGIFAGLRLALIYAWLGNIGAEYFMSSGIGIGSLMINAQQLMDMPTILCGMVLVGILGALLDKAGRLLEIRATRWRQQEQL